MGKENTQNQGVILKGSEKTASPAEIHSAIDDKSISVMLANYASTQINLIGLSDEDKKQKLVAAEEAVNMLADSLGPKGLLQNMLVVELLGVHELQQKLLLYANKSIHTPEHGQYYMNAVTKLSNVFIQQASLLHKLQGNSQQKVVVEHLHINEGGQAIVGHVNIGKEGGSQ